MIKEAYCSYEVAKLLKEKGFNVPCCRRYAGDSMVTQSALYSTPFYQEEKTSGYVLCPTHQMAMAWFREKGFYIEISFTQSIEETLRIDCIWVIYDKDYNIVGECLRYYKTYEEAIEAALKYVLENLI